MPGSGPVLSVVLPTRNEAQSLPPLMARLDAATGGVESEICVVDDSDDDTPTTLERLAAERPGRLRCLFRQGQERRGGLSTAVVAGMRMAQGDHVLVMDADLQHPPETIPAMLAAARAGADIVVASRYARGGSAGGLHGLVRRLVSRSATALARLLFKEARRSSDPLSGFFLCHRRLVDGIEFRPVGFKILLELLVLSPGVAVRDVPLRFAAREHGTSKATLKQGLQFLRHVRSLFLDVPGSARPWKFAIVGASGLAIFLPVLGLLHGVAHLHPLVAFLPAFLLSLGWNTALNRMWTFADRRRRAAGEGPGRYLRWATLSGLLMLGTFAGLDRAGLRTLLAAALAALVAAVANGIANRHTVVGHPSGWAQVATDLGVQAALARLAAQLGADRAYILPARLRGAESLSIPAEVLVRVVERRRPALWTEAASYRPQRRANIEATSTLLVPVVREGKVVGVVVCERWAPRGFDPGALETATQAVSAIAAAMAEAGEEPHGTAVAAARPG